jgi:hypothetical protein
VEPVVGAEQDNGLLALFADVAGTARVGGPTAALIAAIGLLPGASRNVTTAKASASVAPRLKSSPLEQISGFSARNCRTSPACPEPASSSSRYISLSGTLARRVFPAALA